MMNPLPVHHRPLLQATDWEDYQLLDCGNGMKYEKWGDVRLVRPDPQVLWQGTQGGQWSTYDGWYHRSASGGGTWEFTRKLPASWEIRYQDYRFRVRPTDFKHTGLFPEQAANWSWFGPIIRQSQRPFSLLNLFGYTGAASIVAAKSGAAVCHVDAAKGMVQWCRENASLNGLQEAPIRYIVDDCIKFVQREIRRGSTYDAIIMDPPSYGRGKSGETWKLEKHLWELLELCAAALAPNARFLLINSYTTGISPTVLANMLQDILGKRRGAITCGEIGLPVVSDGKTLPCGIYCRWENL
ncbi:hypothetical protein Selin_2270 [Desulfurispirillum indicum S5]|uniref:S-adenosylmethionine-dependent methyltransferase domain-containing protein n=1 Tax=Desulfurispirillum indicum (strain ATCC BAA-1389 / DSM 22839 / S5) TaxID=653733 RepID=E6W426_DESIS|nr:class I SAM-dependent methyltransferase [Desulfurispirillum indicum]ADU66990.1 hypothetical protein Selin_2270 [Desulfurispirillum indicum S5]